MDGQSEPRVFNNESFALGSTFTKFHRLPLPLDRIFLVDNAQSLRECTRALCVVSYVLCCCCLRNFVWCFILECKINLEKLKHLASICNEGTLRSEVSSTSLCIFSRETEGTSICSQGNKQEK